MIKRILLIILAIFLAPIVSWGQWQFANGPYYNLIQDLVIDPQHPDTLFCASVIGNGVYKTEDGGATWVGMEIDSNLTRVQVLAMAHNDPNVLYAGGFRGIDKTEDGGNSWSHLSLSRDIYDLAVDPTNSDVVYAGTSNGVLQSTDGGLSWKSISNGLPREPLFGAYPKVQAIAIDPINPAILYAGTYHYSHQDGLYKTTNAGSSWVYVKYNNLFFHDIVFDPIDPNIVYVAARQGLFRSSDAGQNWNGLFGSAQSIAIDPSNTQILYCGTEFFGIFTSADGGTTWADISEGFSLRAADVRAIVINPQNSDVVYLGTWIGVFKAVDGFYSWAPQNEGFLKEVSLLSVVGIDSTVVIYTGGPLAGVQKSINGGQTWSYAGLFSPTAIAAAPTDPDLVFGGDMAMWASLHRTTDGGINWEYTGLWNDPRIEAIAIDPFNSNLVYAGVGRVAKSTDGGDNWDTFGPSGPKCIRISSQNPQILYVGTWNGIFRSDDEGITWNFAGLEGMNVQTVAIDPLDPQVVYATVLDEGIFKSTDAGHLWFKVSEGLTNLKAQALIIHPYDTERLYAGTKGGGVFQSSNGETSWVEMNDGLENLNVFGLAFDPKDPSRIYAATEGGVYIYTGSTGLEADSGDEIPSSFTLIQNYPNPFNANTEIRYWIPEDSHVTLKIFNTVGQEVRTLVDIEQKVGEYKVKWNGRDEMGREVASGLYFCRLEAGSFGKTIKMVLVK